MHLRPREAVRALVVRDDTVLLARSHDRYDTTRAWWELPGGGMEPGEDPEQALAREMREETGYVDIEVGAERWHWTTEWVFSDREVLQHDRVHVVRLRSQERVEPQPEEAEGLAEVVWVPLALLDALRAPLVPVDLRSLIAELDPADPLAPPRDGVRELAFPPRVPWPMADGAQVLVQLWAEPGRAGDLRALEDDLLRMALDHQGQVTARTRPLALGPHDEASTDRDGTADGLPDEVQLVRFPGPLELNAFLADPRRVGLDTSCVARTEVVPVGWVTTPPVR